MRYAVRDTGVAYGATRVLRGTDVADGATRCAVLTVVYDAMRCAFELSDEYLEIVYRQYIMYAGVAVRPYPRTYPRRYLRT
eukprot:1901099-Rhodomonas_salina.1